MKYLVFLVSIFFTLNSKADDWCAKGIYASSMEKDYEVCTTLSSNQEDPTVTSIEFRSGNKVSNLSDLLNERVLLGLEIIEIYRNIIQLKYNTIVNGSHSYYFVVVVNKKGVIRTEVEKG